MALTLIQTQTVSNVTEVDFTSGISSSFDNYVLIASNGSIEPGDNPYALHIQFSTDGGSTYLDSSYLNYGDISFTTSGLDLVSVQDDDSTTAFNFYVNLLNLTKSDNLPSLTGTYLGCSIDGDGGYGGSLGGLYNGGSIAVNALRINMSDNSEFSGIFSLYSLDS